MDYLIPNLSACTKTLQARNLKHIFVYGLWYFVMETLTFYHIKSMLSM